MPGTVEISELLERRDHLHGGRPVLSGTGVSVHRIAGWYKLGMTAEEIAANYGHLSLALVHAALAYYHANREEIESYLEAEEAAAQRLERGDAKSQAR
jgi:uncharacterized protein (DUF433 family)